MVQLKVYHTWDKWECYLSFQFLNGSIKRNSPALRRCLVNLFQFLNGSIKRNVVSLNSNSVDIFQFLNGSIKSMSIDRGGDVGI